MLEHTLRTYQSPTRLVQRLGAIRELGAEAALLGIRRPLLVTDPGVKAAGLLDTALEALRASDVEPVVFDRVKANPPVDLVDAGAAEYKKSGCDGLVAIGGGSSIDTAKGIGVVAAHDGSILDYEWGHDPIKNRIPPMIAVPTTAGTGSEVTLWAVITDPKRKIKFNVGGTSNIASWVALIDPELSVKLPGPVTAGTGMDALAHAVECYTMSYHQPFTDAVALLAMEYVARHLRVAFSQGENLQARYYMSAAAMLAGLAYGTDSAGAAHAMSQTAGGVHDAPHGARGRDGRRVRARAHRRGRDPEHAGAGLQRGRDPDARRQGLRRPADDRQPARRERRGLSKDLRAGIRHGQEPRPQGEVMTVDVARSLRKMFVDGEWVDSESGRHFDAVSPATGAVIAQVAEGTRADARQAVEAAHRARSAVAGLKGFERSRRLHRIADAIELRREDLARILTLDQGKPLLAEAYGEVGEAAEYFRIAAEDLKRLEGSVIPSASPSKLIFTRRVPRGVYGVITPWNWPLTMATELIAPALAAGNTVVWTPASSTSVISVALMECIAEGDFPPGAVNLVTGPGAEVGDEVAGHPLVDGVGFVGSTATGASVARRAAGKHVMLELGGNGPMIVFGDADIDHAVEGTIVGCYLCAGQSCTAGERILVHESVHDEYVAKLDAAAQKLKLGDPFAPDTTLGPLNNEGVATKMDDHIADALNSGARLVLGGRRAEGYPTRLYYPATILDAVTPQMLVSREETFGPIAPVIKFKDEAEAIAIANDSPYGLLGAVYTRDLSRALRMAEALEVGWVNINESSNYWEAHIPFGGRAGKRSGIGRVGGRGALEQMTDLKTVVIEIEGS